MEPQCSCSACGSFACLAKRHPLSIYGSRKPEKTFLFFNKLDKKVSTLSFDDFKLEQKVSKDNKDEIDVTLDKNSQRSTDMLLVTACEDNLKCRHDNSYCLASSRNTLRPSAAKLSAQVMNVPFNDVESSLLRHDSASQVNVSKLTPFDIFEKIKEVYKACSCKVCECIAGKSQKNELCKCKPCDCDDCKNLKKKVTIANNFTSLELTQAQATSNCLRLQKSLFDKFLKQEFIQECNCKPCQCTECVKSLSMPCSCVQSSCIECKARYSHNKYQKLVVAAVESDNQSHQECMCTPCNCAECNHRLGTSSLRHEMSTEINRPENCHCEACLNEACSPDGTNMCSCARRDGVMRKPVQRDTDYDIHRSIISRQNPCRQNLIAMFAAVSKIYPGNNSQVNQCKCSQCEGLYCNRKEDSADAVKTSNVISDNNRNIFDTVQYKTLKTTKSCLDRSSEIKTISKFSSHNTCRRNLCECIEFDNKKASCTGDVCDCTPCKCERCISNDEIIYPIKKGEKLTPAIYENKMKRSFITFCDENNQNDDDNYETPLKKTRLSSIKGHYKIILPNNDLADVYDDQSHKNYSKIEQQLCQHCCTESNKIYRVKPFSDYSSTTRAFNNNEIVKFQASNPKMGASYAEANYRYMNNDINSQSKNKYQNKKCNTSDHNDSKNTIQYPKKTMSYLSDNNYLDTDNRPKTINVLSNNNTDNINVSLNIHNRYAYGLFGINALSSRSAKDNEEKPRKLRYDECFDNNVSLPSVNESSQYKIIESNKSSDKVSVNQTASQNKNPISRKKKHDAENCKRAVHYSKSIEKPHNAKEVNPCDPKELAFTTKNNFNLDEDYKRVQKTIKDARAFSLHLMKLLEKYEKANKEFVSDFHKLTLPKKTYIVHHVVSIPPKITGKENEDMVSGDYSGNEITKDSFDVIPTRESNENTSCFDSRHRGINNRNTHGESVQSSDLISDKIEIISSKDDITKSTQESSQYIVTEHSKNVNEKMEERINTEDRIKLLAESTQPSDYSTCNMNLIRNNEPLVKSIHEISKDIDIKNSEKVVETFAHMEPKETKFLNKTISDLSCNDDVIISMKHNSLDTLNFTNSDLVDDSVSRENVNSIIDAPLRKRNIKKKSTRYVKMHKRASVVVKRRKLFVPTCSITTEDSDDLDDSKNDYNDKELLNVDESKLSIGVTENTVDENVQEPTDDSVYTINTTENIHNLNPQSTFQGIQGIQHQDIPESRDVVMIKSPLETEHLHLKETYNRTTGSEVTVGVYRKRSLGKGIQEAVNAIKQASMTWESKYANARQGSEGRFENVALKRLHSEVRKLLEMPLLQKCENLDVQCNDNHVAKNDLKYESLKVNFVTVRKISDSTIVVKWQVPRVLENVQGYEVLVNGRAVQKIQDRFCYESVLSGLPIFDKILVTVRTVTKRSGPSGHSPTATVIYRPPGIFTN